MSSATSSRHVSIEPLADGVWAAIHRPGGWAVGNAGIVDLGGATLLFDACITPDAFEDVVAASVELTGRPPTYLALSHYHNDHIRGAQLLPGTPLLATRRTRELIDTLGREELDSDLEHAEGEWRRFEAMAGGDDPMRRAFAATFTSYWEGLAVTAPSIELQLPTVTFEGTLGLHGSRRGAELVSLGAAHTGDDAVLWIPDAGVVFCADLLFVRSHPYLADGDPDGLERALVEVEQLGAERCVPGHGPVGGSADVVTMQRHVAALRETAARLLREGRSADEVSDLLPDDATRDWEFVVPFYAANLRFLMERVSTGAA
jgi:cyclase